jgi:hypothetical protein
MAYFGNLQYSSSDNHIGINISAEKVEGVETLEEYLDSYVDYMLEPYDGDAYTLIDEDQATIHDRLFELRIFDVAQEARPFRIISYTCEAEEGYFLSLDINYWPDNRKALENIRSLVEAGLEFI